MKGFNLIDKQRAMSDNQKNLITNAIYLSSKKLIFSYSNRSEDKYRSPLSHTMDTMVP